MPDALPPAGGTAGSFAVPYLFTGPGGMPARALVPNAALRPPCPIVGDDLRFAGDEELDDELAPDQHVEQPGSGPGRPPPSHPRRHVGRLPGQPPRPPDEAAVRHEGPADPRPEVELQEGVHEVTAAPTVSQLGDGGPVHVVVDLGGLADDITHARLAQHERRPLQVDEPPGAALHRVGHRDGDGRRGRRAAGVPAFLQQNVVLST